MKDENMPRIDTRPKLSVMESFLGIRLKVHYNGSIIHAFSVKTAVFQVARKKKIKCYTSYI